MRLRRALPLLVLAACGRPDIAFPATGSNWPDAPIPSWATSARFAISDNADDTIAFVSTDLPSPKLYGELPVGLVPVELEGPHHLTASPDGAWLLVPLSEYVPGSGSGPHGPHGIGTAPGHLLQLDARSGALHGAWALDRDPGDVVVSSDGATAFVSHYDLLRLEAQVAAQAPEATGFSSVAVVDTRGATTPPLYPVCATAHGMALSADEKTLYAVCSQTDQLAALDLATHQATRVAVGPGPGPPLNPTYFPYAVRRAPVDDSLWISCNRSGELRVFDTHRGAIDESRTVQLTGIPMFGAFLRDGKTLVMPHQGDDKLSLVDTTTSTVLATIPLPPTACDNAHVATVTADDATAYVVCEGDHVTQPGTVVAVSLPARTVVGYVAVGLYPDGIALLPPN